MYALQTCRAFRCISLEVLKRYKCWLYFECAVVRRFEILVCLLVAIASHMCDLKGARVS
jgi:hypothetical protein